MKPLHSKHNIKSLLFDIIFDDERRAEELYEDVHRLHYQELENVISSCLDQFAGKETFASLEEIELDLGTMHYKDLESQFANRVYESLSEKLKELFNNQNRNEGLKIRNAITNLEVIKHFLIEGYLPWNSKGNIATLFANSLREEKEAIALMLQDIGRSEKVRQRLIRRFDISIIKNIVQILSPNSYKLVFEFQHQLVSQIFNHNVLNVPKSGLEKEVWLMILNYLFLNPSKENQITSLIKDSLIQFSEKYQLSFSELIAIFGEETKYTKNINSKALKDILNGISKVLNVKYLKESNLDKKYIHLDFAEKTKILIHFLFNKTLISTIGNVRLVHLKQHLMEVLTTKPEKLIDLLVISKNIPILVNNMVSLFGLKPIHTLIRNLEHGDYKTIIVYHQNFISIHQKEPIVSVPEKSFSNIVWEVIISLLMNRSGSYFNQKTFVKDIIKQLSNRYNVDYISLVNLLEQSAIRILSKSSRVPDFVKLLIEICSENKLTNTGEVTDDQKNKNAIYNIEEKEHSKFPIEDFGTNSFFEQQKNRKIIVQYFLNKQSEHSLSLIRILLLKSLEVEPELMIQAIKKQTNFYGVLERIVYDFDEEVILSLLKAVDPVNYQGVIDIHDATLSIQKEEHFIPVGINELSDALWNIILKILFSDTTSRFNQKSFLKKVLNQTAAHYNVSCQTLVDQIFGVIKTLTINYSGSSKYNLFIQLIQEIEEEEKNAIDKKGKQSKVLSKRKGIPSGKTKSEIDKKENSRVSEILIEMVLTSPSEAFKILAEKGFANLDEATKYLVLYQKDLLIKTLKNTSSNRVKVFISLLPIEALNVLIHASDSNFSRPLSTFLEKLNQRLHHSGFMKREELMKQVKANVLYFSIKSNGSHYVELVKDLEKIIDQHKLPDAFFEETSWEIPVKGNIDENLRGLEQRINLAMEGQLLAKSKTKLVLEELINISNSKHTNVEYTKHKKEKGMEQEIYLTNAGLVILNGYLHFFFDQCGYLNDDGILKPEVAPRAALLLQYVFDPEGVFGEEELVLNKIICGLVPSTVLPYDFEPTETEKNISNQMFDAIISHWKMVSNSTHEGFRESWLQREGKLTKKEKHWDLIVEKRSFDILLDYKPFTLSPVKFEWMKKPIKVNWR